MQQQLLKISGVKYDSQTKELEDFKQSIESLSSIQINPENLDTAYSKLTELSTKYGETFKALNDARDEALRAANLAEYDSEEQKQSVINAINSIYDIKEEDLSKAYSAIQNIGSQIENVWATVYKDFKDSYVPEYDFLGDTLGVGKDYDERVADALKEYKEEMIKQYGKFASDTTTYVDEQMAIASGKTIEEIKKTIKNNTKTAQSTLEDSLSKASKAALSSIFTTDAVNATLNRINGNMTSLWGAIKNKSKENATQSADATSKSFWETLKSDFTTESNNSTDYFKNGVWGNLGKAINDESSINSSALAMINTLQNKINAFSNSMSINPITVPIELELVKTATDNLIISGLISALTISGFATGGMPRSGELFFANENGKAELISTIGNRPAVANQQQMRSEIRQGVREGMAEAFRMQTNGNGDVYVFIDSDQIATRIERRSAQKAKMTGGR